MLEIYNSYIYFLFFHVVWGNFFLNKKNGKFENDYVYPYPRFLGRSGPTSALSWRLSVFCQVWQQDLAMLLQYWANMFVILIKKWAPALIFVLSNLDMIRSIHELLVFDINWAWFGKRGLIKLCLVSKVKLSKILTCKFVLFCFIFFFNFIFITISEEGR